MPDLDYLKKLLGDENIVARFLELFRQQMPVQLADLQNQIAGQDWENAGATAHAIKGQLRYLREEEAAELAYRLEQLAEEGGGDEAWRLAAGLSEHLERILRGLIDD